MRRYSGFLVLIIVVVLIYLLDKPLGSVPAIGRLLDPVNGCWANAEPVNKDFSRVFMLKGRLKHADIWFDERLVPHIHAGNEHDVYFWQGYVHAYFRLWQMDMQTRAAAGRISEVVGERALNFDRKQRFKGMVYGAERSLAAMEADPRTRQMMDAYTEGVNTYIASLKYGDYPLEYKLMGFVPEKWTNLKIALLLKYMADDLTGKTDDIALTYLRDVLPKAEFDLLYPERVAGATPAIPAGTTFDKPSLPVPVAPADSVAFPHFLAADFGARGEDGKGSNNWAVSGAKTASGAAILCNDPHLGLNLPSLWYEVQLQAPGMNVYGASLPGTPGVILGFNDSLTWGFTNNYRDVKDFYEIRPVAGDKGKYWFAGKQLEFSRRVEHIRVKGKPDIIDTVDYTIHGPVTYEQENGKTGGLRRPLAMCWMGHRPTNEVLAIYLLNRARGYEEFVDAILHFECPAQNMAYADAKGNIALWGQGQFVNLWKGQGRYVMNGSDSATLWRDLIPMRENPHVLNPQQGFVSSANQVSTDSTYPYWYNSSGFVNLRAWRINSVLGGMEKATVQDMFALQNDVYSELAAQVTPIMLRSLRRGVLSIAGDEGYSSSLDAWDYRLLPESKAAAIFQVWWGILYGNMWSKRLPGASDLKLPLQEVTARIILQADTEQNVAGGVVVGHNNGFEDYIRSSFMEAIDTIKKLQNRSGSEWYKVKNTSVNHLAKLPAFSYSMLKTGGWGNTVNAMKGDHGPSWRMVVQMGKEIEAYGVYPGGQSGNPGSKYYADFLQHWVEGKYYRLLFLPNASTQSNERVKYVWKVN